MKNKTFLVLILSILACGQPVYSSGIVEADKPITDAAVKVTTTPSPIPPTATSTLEHLSQVEGEWNCRTAPDLDAPVSDYLHDGDQVVVLDVENGWAHVRLETDRGCWTPLVAVR